MKKWGFLFFVLFGLSFVFVKETSFQDHVEVQIYKKNNHNKTPQSSETIEITKGQVFQGNLLLVNHEYPLQREGIKSDVINLFTHQQLINGYVLLNNEIKLSEDVALEFSKMVAAAEQDGVRNFSINSGFRDFDEQQSLYLEMGSDYALPAGHSEHNLGLSLDVGSTQMKMANAPEGKWIEENAWKYGFILRYPKDKTAVTGIEYEPWHIRYVGLPHSAIMKEKNLALEEYMDYLKKEKAISTTILGEKYEISYYPVTKDTTIHVPSNLHTELSGNNMDGVIVTVFHGSAHSNVKRGRLAE